MIIKRYLLLALFLLIMVASISGTNAAYSRQIALAPDVFEAASPTPLPTPTPTPTPKPWSGEFELEVYIDGNIWRSENPERLLGNMRFRLHNNTGTGTMAAVDAKKWALSFSANLAINDIYNATLDRQGTNQYTIISAPHMSLAPGDITRDMGSGVSTYDLTRMVDGVKTRTTNPTLHELIFSNVRLSTAAKNNEALVLLEPHRVRIRYVVPAPLTGWTANWEQGVYYPPGWAPVH